jgi:hypothetical protein
LASSPRTAPQKSALKANLGEQRTFVRLFANTGEHFEIQKARKSAISLPRGEHFGEHFV